MGSSASPSSERMTSYEKFLFDLNGFIVLRNMLTPQEVDAMNAAVDAHKDGIRERKASALQNTPLASKLSAPPEDIENNFLKLTKCYTRRDPSAT